MKGIIKFTLLFVVLYAGFILLLQTAFMQPVVNGFFRDLTEWTIKASLPKAYIETQDFIDNKGKADPNVFYLVYGNPEVIRAEQDYAARMGLREYKISTYSIQFYIFQMFTVPLAFLVAIFLATPAPWKRKSANLVLSLLILTAVILLKCSLLGLYTISEAKIGLYALSESSLSLVYRVVMALTLGFSIIFGFCLWLIFGFRYSPFSNQFLDYLKRFQK